MNLHPLLTHFPVALLTIYSVLELVRFKRMMERPYWFYIKACLIIIGTLISYATFYTGYIQKDDFTSGEIVKVVNAHFYAGISTLSIFTILSIGYIVGWLEKENFFPIDITLSKRVKFYRLLLKLKSFILSSPVSVIGAFLGLTAITVTGALGGALAYGKDVDPFVKMMYEMIVK